MAWKWTVTENVKLLVYFLRRGRGRSTKIGNKGAQIGRKCRFLGLKSGKIGGYLDTFRKDYTSPVESLTSDKFVGKYANV
jgi:hypothetical protein